MMMMMMLMMMKISGSHCGVPEVSRLLKLRHGVIGQAVCDVSNDENE